MGSDAPKELRDPRRSLIEGVRESWCMYGEGSAMLVLVAGTSIELGPPASWPFGTGKLSDMMWKGMGGFSKEW